MSSRDAIELTQKIDDIIGLLNKLKAEGEASSAETSLAEAPAPGAGSRAFAASPALQLTDAQRRICVRVINAFETGKAEGDYGAISIFHDGPNRIRQVTYGRAQTTEYGNLRELVSDYVAANGRFSASLKPFVDLIGTKVGTPPHSPLVDNQTFLSLLRQAGADPVMKQTQDAFFDRVYLSPALGWAGRNGFTKALSGLVIYDSFTHSGGILAFLRARFPESTPANGGDEKTWIAEYVAVRQDWLANNDNPEVRPSVYRTQDLTREIKRNNWDLAIAPILAHGVPVNGAPDASVAPPTPAAEASALSVDDDPGAPGEDEVSDALGLDAARARANEGASEAFDEVTAAAPPAGLAASFDIARAQAFLKACMTSTPRVTYGLGKKVPSLNAVPGRDFTEVDCSGFVREAVRLSTSPVIAFPDGSVVEHDWVRAHGFLGATIADGKKTDSVTRIAFLRPQDSPKGIGHVVLISNGMTLESHSHVGPDSRKWDGTGWQAKALVFVLAKDGKLALPGALAFAEGGTLAKAEAPAQYTVRRGHRYRATVVLSGFEQFASNDVIASRLSEVGFANVVVTGNGATRVAEGLWSGPDTTAEVDSHLRDIVELPTTSGLTAGRAAAAPGDIGVQGWEDDPEPAVLVGRPTPDLAKLPLAFAFDQPAPALAVYEPGTPEFRYWTAAEALRRGADFWAPLMPTPVWQPGPTLNVILDEGEDLNAYYDRQALNFFHGQGVGGVVYSGESPDVVCHEMGHGILDSIRPQLFDAGSSEVAAFHESFADISAILSALQLQSLRLAILSDTHGRLYASSRLSRLAEQLGSAIRLTQADAVEPDCLRNAVNSWVYQDPTTLPQGGPATQLTSEPHNFSRVFTGAVYEIMGAMLSAKASDPSAPTEQELQAVSEDIAKILISGVQSAPVVPNWYAQVAAAMVNASAGAQFDGRYSDILKSTFARRSILSTESAASVVKLHGSVAAIAGGPREVDQPLADIALSADDYGLAEPIVLTAASHARPFLATSAATSRNGSIEPVSSSTAARAFLDDLFTRGRVDYGDAKDATTHFHHARRLCSHVLVREKNAIRLRRRLFDCGFVA